MKTIRYYLMPLAAPQPGERLRLAVPLPLQQGDQVQTYFLPGFQWGMVRLRTEQLNHDTISAVPGVLTWPRGKTQTWKFAVPPGLRTRLTALGVTIPDDVYPDAALDLLGQFHQDQMGGYRTPWSRARERQPLDEATGAVEEL